MTTPAASREMPRPGTESNAKRAAKVADRIVEDVMALGWPVGEVLGSEADLLERYHVSRAVFREAVRLVEHQQVARTRRGPGGGLVITEPTVGAVSDAVVLYLHRVDATLDEIFEARIILEELACQLAAERTDEADLAALRRFVEEGPMEPGGDPRGLHVLVAEISRNAGLELFVDVFNQVAQLYSPDWQHFGKALGRETEHAHAKIAEAIMAGDAGLARNRMRKHLEAEAEFFRRRRSTRQLLPDSVVLAESPQGKGAEAVARHITPDRRGREPPTGRPGRDRAGADRARGSEPGPAPRSGPPVGVPPHRAHASRPRRRPVRDGPERQRRDRDGRHLPGPPRNDAGRVGRAPYRRRGGDHRPGGATHR